jgi:hypothetical protein
LRRALTAIFVAVAALAVIGVLGVAVAEGPGTTPPRTVSVQGVATESIDQNANANAATAVYRRGMADAIADGATKAQFLATHAGANLGTVQSIVEEGGNIACAGESEYLGEQPDFGSPGGSVQVLARSPGRRLLAGKVAPRRRSHKTPAAKKANVATCTLATQVALVYTIS